MTKNDIIALYQNTQLKAEFINNYTKAKFSPLTYWSVRQAENQWATICSMIAEGLSNQTLPQLHLAAKSDLISALLMISEQGLSFDKKDKQIYLYVEFNEQQIPLLKILLGYKGMQLMCMRTGLFKYLTSELVYQGDKFTWRGESTPPEFESAGSPGNRKLACGFVGLKYRDGDWLHFRMDAEELEEVERAAKAASYMQTGSEENSLYSTPWRNRMLKIALWRNAYNWVRSSALVAESSSWIEIDRTGHVGGSSQNEFADPVLAMLAGQ